MTVTSPTAEYRILHRLKSSPSQTAFLARSAETVLLVRLTDSEMIADTGAYFESLAGNGIVIEAFKNNRAFWISLCNDGAYESVQIKKALTGLDLQERYDLAKKLMEAICARNIPWPMLYDVLIPERIGVDAEGAIGFIYLPEVFVGYDRDCRASCFSRLAELLRLIYGGDGSPHVDEFAAELCDMSFSSLEELRTGFKHLYTSIDNTPAPPRERLSFPERLRSLAKRLRELYDKYAELTLKLTAAAVLIAGYIVLGRAIYDAIFHAPISGDITAIGTVEIYENSEP